MASVTTIEQAYVWGALNGQSGSIFFRVNVTGDALAPGAIRALVVTFIATPANNVETYNGLPLFDIRIIHKADWCYIAEAIYKSRTPKTQVVESEYGPVVSFSTTGGTQHITQSPATTSYAKTGDTAPDFKGAIGYDGERVAGVDIGSAKFEFSEDWSSLDPTTFDNTYLREKITPLTYKTNNAAFRGYATGSVLFLGAEGRRSSGGVRSITFKFAVSPNATGLTIGEITGVNKLGWDYLWVLHKSVEDQGSLIKQPKAAYVESVYESGSFSDLGIGVSATYADSPIAP